MHWKKFLPIIGIALFIYLIIKIDVINIYGEIGQINLFYFSLAVILTFGMFLMQTFKWWYVARIQNIHIYFWRAVAINTMSHFYGSITPSKAGGIIRAEYLKAYTPDKNIGHGLFNFTIDKIMDLLAVLFMLILFSFVFRNVIELPVALFIGMFFIAVIVTLIFMNKQRSKFFLKFFYSRFISKKYQEKARITFDAFYERAPSKSYLFLFFFLSVINWISIYAVMYVLGLSLGISLSFIHYLAILPLGTIAGMLPISISGIGTRDAVIISLFGLFGVTAAKVFSMSLINLVLVGLIPSIIGIIFILREK
ncbi:MAG: lysylphosphatidylglycerol synthase transmembrane domain-containing protein [Nanoarchaeota archaeon]